MATLTGFEPGYRRERAMSWTGLDDRVENDCSRATTVRDYSVLVRFGNRKDSRRDIFIAKDFARVGWKKGLPGCRGELSDPRTHDPDSAMKNPDR